MDLEISVDTTMMKKWLKPKRGSSLKKQPEWETQKKKKTLCVREFSKRSMRVVTRLRELEKVRNRIIRQLVPETRDCRHKTAMSEYFTDKEALKAYIVTFEKHFQSTLLKEEAISLIASSQSSLEAARKKISEKKRKTSYRTTKAKTTKSRTRESSDKEGPGNSSN